MKKVTKRMIGLLLALIMILQVVPVMQAEAADAVILSGQLATKATEVLYEENFDSYGTGKITLAAGENEDYNIAFSGSGTAYIENGRLYVGGSGYNTAYIMGGEMWGYYTVEADICHTAESENWVGLNYYVQSGTKWQKASLKKNGEAKVNGYEDGTWVNDGNANGYTHVTTVQEFATTNLTENDVLRMKIVVNGKTSTMYYARYTDYTNGVLGEWKEVLTINSIPASSQTGSVGLVTGSNGGAWIDNLKVTRNLDQKDLKHTLLSIDFEEYTGENTATLTAGTNDYYGGMVYTPGSNSTGSLTLKNGRLYMSGDQYDTVYFKRDDAQHWIDYVVEADFCYEEGNKGWSGLLYRTLDGKNTLKGGVYYNSDKVSLNARKGGSWYNDNTTHGIHHKPTGLLAATGLGTFGVGDAHRMKIVVNGNCADLYVARYDAEGKLGDWTYMFSTNDIDDNFPGGTIGVMTSGNNEFGSFWVDNIEVYEYANAYVENFDSYGEVTLATGANNGIEGVGVQYTLNGGTTGNSLSVTGGKLKFVASSDSATGKHDYVWFNAGKNWTNYSYEVDVTYHNEAQWGTLLTRVDDKDNFLFGGIQPPTRLYLGTYLNGSRSNSEGTKDAIGDKETAGKDKWTITNLGVVLNEPFRVKFVVRDNCAYLYVAFYKDGELQPYKLMKWIENVTANQYDGTVGFLGVKGASYSIDNLVVTAGPAQIEPEEPTFNLVNIAVPETGVVNPPVIIQKVDSLANYTSLATNGAAIAFMNIDASMNIVDANGAAIATAAKFMEDYGKTMIPAFRVDNGSEVNGLISFLNDNEIIDALVVAGVENCDRLLTIRQACPNVRGVLEYSENLDTVEKRAASRRLANNHLASIVLLPEGSVTAEISAEYNARTISVWSFSSDEADVYTAIANGYNGVVAADAAVVSKVYSGITTTTLSGIPMAIGHRGRSEQKAPENTIAAFKSAYFDFNAAGVEIDLKFSKDGELVLMHDGTIDRSTNGTGSVSAYTVEELKQFRVEVSNNPEIWDYIPTFEEVLVWAKENAPDLVIYCHTGSNTAARFKELVTKYGMEDNVIAFCRYNTSKDWANSVWGDGIPVIGGNSSGPYDPVTGVLALDSQDHALESMIKVFSQYNHQAMPYEYDEVTSGGKDDSFYYKMSARGFIGLHSTTNAEATFDRYFVTGGGIAGALTDFPEHASPYFVDIVEEDLNLTAGQVIPTNLTVKKVLGEEKLDCNVQWISGDTLVSGENGYTMNAEGEATIVYYADVSLTRGSGALNYRVYSEPVTVTYGSPIKLDKTEAELSEGEELQLAVIDAGEAAFTWSTSDDKIATVDQTGKVTAVSEGTATITVTAVDGGHTAVCKVTVLDNKDSAVKSAQAAQAAAEEAQAAAETAKADAAAAQSKAEAAQAAAENAKTEAAAAQAAAAEAAKNAGENKQAAENAKTAADAAQEKAEAAQAEAEAAQAAAETAQNNAVAAQTAADTAKTAAETAAQAAQQNNEAAAAEAAKAAADAAKAAGDSAKSAEEALKAATSADEAAKSASESAGFAAAAAASAKDAQIAQKAAEEAAKAAAADKQAAEEEKKAAQAAQAAAEKAMLACAKYQAVLEMDDAADEIDQTGYTADQIEAHAAAVAVAKENIAAAETVEDVQKALNAGKEAVSAVVEMTPAEPDNKPEDEPEDKPTEPTTPSEPEKAENPFVDIKEDMFCYDAVLWAYENEITTGKDATHFNPSGDCTRAQVVTFLWRAAGEPEPKDAKVSFPDVATGKYYTKAVAWAVENGITAGYKDGTFGPNDTCTRGQIVTFLWRYADEAEAKDAKTFPDVVSGKFYTDAVAWAVEEGITSGYKDGTFGPDKTCTRDQIVTFLYRYMAE